jgi:hypothetical protein
MPDISTIKLKIRRGTDLQRKSVTLEQGELGYTIDTRRVFIGDGVSLGGNSVGNNTLPPSPVLTNQTTALVGDTIYSNNILYQLTAADFTNLSNWANINAKPDNTYITYDASNRLTVTSSLISTATGTVVNPEGAIINTIDGIKINSDESSIAINTSINKLIVKDGGIDAAKLNTSAFNNERGLSGGNGVQIGVKIAEPLVFAAGNITLLPKSITLTYLGDDVYSAFTSSLTSGWPAITDLSLSALSTDSGAYGFKNKVINSNFDFWQRYNPSIYTSLSINPAAWPVPAPYKAADRWNTYINLPNSGYTGTYSVIRMTSDAASQAFFNSNYFLRLSSNVTGTTNLGTINTDGEGALAICSLENAYEVLGREVTLSFWARSQNPTYIVSESQIHSTPTGLWTPTIANKVFQLSNVWQYFYHTFLMPTSAQVVAASFDPSATILSPPSYTWAAPPPLSSWVFQVDLKTFWTNSSKIRHGNPGDAFASSRPGWPVFPGPAMTNSDFSLLTAGFAANKTGWYDIAQIQLERGNVPTPFEYKPVGTELVLCQRYYEKGYNVNVSPGTTFLANDIQNHEYTTYIPAGLGVNGLSAMYISHRVPFKVTKAVTPTIITYSPQTGTQGRADLIRVGTYLSSYNVTVADVNTNQFHTNTTSTTGFFDGSMQWTADAEI